jgi:predicted TIM-barrel fold metal-dependent hydrolase
MSTTKAAQIRDALDHPIIDGDGHIVEILPVFLDYLRQAGGPSLAERYRQINEANSPYHDDAEGWYALSPKDRQQRRLMRPPSWLVNTADARERATTMLPNLIRSRLDEFGIDFAIMYTSVGIPIASSDDDDIRLGGCRALNLMYADLFDAHKDRMTPSAVIPMHTPEEAIAEMEFAVTERGFKTVTIPGCVRRPLENASGNKQAVWIDPLAVDSLYDYDPVWAKCLELGVAPATHHSGMGAGWGARGTTTNFMYNHIGHFAAGADAACKAMFMGGVTRRFPDLRIAFLEGGAGWALSLLNDIVEHWEKRNIGALQRATDPALLNRDDLANYFREFAEDLVNAVGDPSDLDSIFASPLGGEAAEDIDDWNAIGLSSKEDIGQRFLPNFFIGCEADDRMNGAAFDTRLNPFGHKLNAFLGSDIGHWDVPDPTKVIPEAWELVDDGLLTPSDFRAFTFENVSRLHTQMNPNFFKGTAVEGAVARL